ncbi:MAG: urate hydroxylase PuuD [Gemmatimonadaceae bacterium]|nr:urate hydroxylase PuuD [Gemmatimonadaceae bacterium]
MSGSAWEIVDLVARWVHVIAGIMWVGNSLLFNWLDRSLQAPSGSTQTRKPVGNVWLLHSGGFYYVEKTLLEGQQMPKPMHWFKWQAYTTWLSGLMLLIVVYWAGGRAVMADAAVSSLSEQSAMFVGVGAVFGGWALYEMMNRFVAPKAPTVSAAVWIGGLIAIAILLTQLIDGRAAFLHVGAMMATIMAGNVFWTIVPSQRELVNSVDEGGASASLKALSARAKRVSIHNNYFTFPVIVLMVSNHFPGIYGSQLSWALLLILIAGGAAVRHVLNIRWTFPSWRPALWVTMIATVLLLIGVMHAANAMSAPTSALGSAASGAASNAPVTFAEVRHIIDRRCTQCHSATPTDPVFTAAPLGVMFDTPEQIEARKARILERAVVTKTMPLGNKTGMTEQERAMLKRWLAAGGRQ